MKGPVSRSKIKELHKYLRRIEPRDLLEVVWSLNQLDESNSSKISLFRFPNDAVRREKLAAGAIWKWEIEGIANEYLTQAQIGSFSGRRIDVRKWGSIAQLVNLYRSVSDAQSILGYKEDDIVQAIQRITWQQFPWQVGFDNVLHAYKNWWLYCGPESSDFFEEKHGVSVDIFTKFCFAIFSIGNGSLVFRPQSATEALGIPDNKVQICLDMISSSLVTQQQNARRDRDADAPIDFRASVLRQRPVILHDGQYFSPIKELILLRATEGLFYSFVADSRMRQVLGERFEKMCHSQTKWYWGDKAVLREIEYSGIASPDILVEDHRAPALKIAIECKARHIPMFVKASPTPVSEAETVYGELAKGVRQIWRFVSDIRNGRVAQYPPGCEPKVGVVLTKESWFDFNIGNLEVVMERARKNLPTAISKEDEIDVVFVSFDGWERIVRNRSIQEAVEYIQELSRENKTGYRSKVKDVEDNTAEVKFPFSEQIGVVLPWWKEIRD